MTDLSLRMPNTRLRAVLNLGVKRAASISLPAHLAAPELFADWDEEARVSGLFVDYPEAQLHLEVTDSGVDHHFHDASGDHSDVSPWSNTDTGVVLEWASLLAADVHALMPRILDDVSEAAAWRELGFDLYICEVEEPAQLDLLDVEVEGELMLLPWLGAGTVSHDHIEGEGHPIALSWASVEGGIEQPIAEAWTDAATGSPLTRALPGIDWDSVGLPTDEVLSWLEGVYLNHHVIPDAEGTLFAAVLQRLGGLD